MEELVLVTPSKKYEEQAINYIREFYQYNSNINGTGGLDRYFNNYASWLLKLEADRKTVFSQRKVPAETFFLVRTTDDKIVGMINIRLALNKNLKKVGGHIGYSIRPTERRKGYAKKNLYLGLEFLKEHGIIEAQVDCIDTNIGSKKTIEALGGKQFKEEKIFEDGKEERVLNFKIDIEKSLRENKEKYKESREKVKIKK